MNRLHLLLILIAVLLVAAYAGWLLETFRGETRQGEEARRHVPDYFLDGFTVTVYAPDGRPRHTLRGERGEHFADDGSIDIVNPRLTVRETVPPWEVEAEHGRILQGGERIDLGGPVSARRAAHDGQPALHLRTRDLRVRPPQRRAETAARASLAAGPHRLTGTGMRLDWGRQRLILLADVESRYVPTP